MRKTPKIYLSWKAVAIVALFYLLFLTGFSLGVHLVPNSASAVVLSEQDRPEKADPGENILILSGGNNQQNSTDEKRELTPRAVVYSTHTSEQYSGQTRKNGVPGGVFSAATALAEALEMQGIGVILLTDVFDAPDWNAAYGNSLAALEKVKKEYPDIELFIDVHRDSAIEGLNTHLASGGIAYARMLLIIGSNDNLPHPNWQSNQAFANSLNDTIDEMLPGIMRLPKVYSGRYNQHIGTQAILVEIGSETNSVEEAKNSAKLLAEALAKLL